MKENTASQASQHMIWRENIFNITFFLRDWNRFLNWNHAF